MDGSIPLHVCIQELSNQLGAPVVDHGWDELSMRGTPETGQKTAKGWPAELDGIRTRRRRRRRETEFANRRAQARMARTRIFAQLDDGAGGPTRGRPISQKTSTR